MTCETIMHLDTSSASFALAGLILSLTAFAAAFLAVYCAGAYKCGRRKTVIWFTVTAIFMAIMLLLFFGLSTAALKGIILCLAFLFASCADIKTRECPDYVHLIILTASFIGIMPEQIPSMLFAAFLVTAFQLAGAIVTDSEINGADLKMSAACAFLLGTERGLLGLVMGMALAVVVNLIKKKGRGEGFPVLPYLSAAFMAADMPFPTFMPGIISRK